MSLLRSQACRRKRSFRPRGLRSRKDRNDHACTRHRASFERCQQCLVATSIIVLATGKIGGSRPRLRNDNRSRQRTRRTRARTESGSTSRPAFDFKSRTSQARLRGLGLTRRRVTAGRRLSCRDVSENARGRDSRAAFDLQQRDGELAGHE